MLEGRFEDCVEIARAQTRDGAHLLDVCVDYVGRDGVADMTRGGRPAGHRVHAAAGARLHRARGHRGRPGADSAAGAVINSVNYEDGDGPDSRIARIMPLVREHGAAVVALTIDEQGQARTAAVEGRGRRAADRRPDRRTGACSRRGHHRGLPHLPDRHRPGGDPPRRHRDHRGDRRAEAALPDGADHAGRVERVVRPQARRPRRAELRLPGRVRAGGPGLRDRARRRRSCPSPASPTSSARSRWTWSTTGGARATTRWRGCWTCSRAWTRPTSRPAGPRNWPRCRCGTG